MFGLFKKKKQEELKKSDLVGVPIKPKKFFDKEKQEKLRSLLIEKSINNPCEFCGKSEWTISDELVRPLIYRSRDLYTVQNVAYPQAMIICTNCGNTKFFNAVVLGIEEQGSKDNNDS